MKAAPLPTKVQGKPTEKENFKAKAPTVPKRVIVPQKNTNFYIDLTKMASTSAL